MPRTSCIRPYMKLYGNESLELLAEATVWDDVRCPAVSAGPGATNPSFVQFVNDGVGSVGVYAHRFAVPGLGDGEDLFFEVQWPHGIKLGTVAVPSIVYPHVHWAPVDANAGNVGWGIEYTEAQIDAVFPATQFVRTAFATPGVANRHTMSGWAGLSSTTRNISGMQLARVFRTNTGGIDTYASNVFLFEYDVHFEMSTIASRTPSAK